VFFVFGEGCGFVWGGCGGGGVVVCGWGGGGGGGGGGLRLRPKSESMAVNAS